MLTKQTITKYICHGVCLGVMTFLSIGSVYADNSNSPILTQIATDVHGIKSDADGINSDREADKNNRLKVGAPMLHQINVDLKPLTAPNSLPQSSYIDDKVSAMQLFSCKSNQDDDKACQNILLQFHKQLNACDKDSESNPSQKFYYTFLTQKGHLLPRSAYDWHCYNLNYIKDRMAEFSEDDTETSSSSDSPGHSLLDSYTTLSSLSNGEAMLKQVYAMNTLDKNHKSKMAALNQAVMNSLQHKAFRKLAVMPNASVNRIIAAQLIINNYIALQSLKQQQLVLAQKATQQP